ncbi:hypothetical protein [Apilactobacillus xinyiensis]|uniref:hypothetical protein n=1 Tax=Apilactobacillus xinyiensis TaxID=2841032 RepID=UPI003364D37A
MAGAEFRYYIYALNEYHWKPHEWANLSRHEKNLIIAAIDLRVAEEKKQKKKAERDAKRH